MKKFDIRPEDLTQKQLLKCIIKESAFTEKFTFDNYYLGKNEPDDYMPFLVEDIKEAIPVRYKERDFYIVKDGAVGNKIRQIFRNNHVYCFDAFYADCPILKKILKKKK